MSIYIEDAPYDVIMLIEDIDLLVSSIASQRDTGRPYTEPGFQFYEDVYALLCKSKETSFAYRLDFDAAYGRLREMLTNLHNSIVDERDLDYASLLLHASYAKETIESEAFYILAEYERELEEDDQYNMAGVPVSHST